MLQGIYKEKISLDWDIPGASGFFLDAGKSYESNAR
jgi:hypothetical protein